ncbi:MAG: ChaN family lipoprotein [Desulfobacteraceae bacterium]|jgi:hypothetical protein
MTTLREQLIQIQKKNYRKNVQLVRKSLGHNPGIEVYRKEYLRYLRDYQEISNKTDLIGKASAADVIFHGDYHTLSQSQRSVLRILREIVGKREIILCLEMFHGSDQKHVDRFMSGELSENSFLEKIDYEKKWPFGWSNWSPVVSFCRENHIPILGINTKIDEEKGMGSLTKRDQYSARIIAKAFIRNPGKLIYVVDGDLHISPNHLPKNVEELLELLDEPFRVFIIFQNAEKLYWKLCDRGLEESDVLKISENMYCVMNTMPANKIQSYLNWLEYSEDAYFPVHKDWEIDDLQARGAMVHEMVTTLASILNLELPADALQKLTIYYPNNLHFMELIHKTPELKTQLRLVKDKIKRGEGFLLEYDRSGENTYLIYLANSNINMAAEEASHFLNAVLRGPLKTPVSPFDHFYRNVITECLGFFGSKFLNEKRKSQSEHSIRRFLGKVKRGERKQTDPETIQVARYILQHFYLQRKTTDAREFTNKFHSQYKSRSAVSRIFSTQLGYMLGNKLYYAVKRGKFSMEKIREFFRDPFDKPMKAFDCYVQISERVKKVKHVSRL